jgi:putative SOS response-associated peptidase YedK
VQAPDQPAVVNGWQFWHVAQALVSRRCLVPADAFYESKTVRDGKQSHAITRRDRAPIAFVGV